MPEIVIRDIPDEIISVLAARAARLGMPLPEYARRRLVQDATAGAAVGVDDFARFATRFADLDDPGAMDGAWR